MILTPPLLDAQSPLVPMRPLTLLERFLAFFDTALVRMVAFAMLTPVMWQALGETAFGVVAVGTALMGLLDWPMRAFSAAVTRTLLAAVRVDDYLRLRRVMLMGWLLMTAMGLLVAFALQSTRVQLVDLLGIEPPLTLDAQDYIALTGLRLGAQASMSVWQSAVLAAGLASELTVVRGVRTLAEILLAVAVATGNVDLPSLGVLELLIVALWGVALLYTRRRAGPGWLPTLTDFDWQTARQLYAQGAMEAAQSTVFLLTFDVGVMVTALVQGVESAALLAVVAVGCRLLAGTALQASELIFDRFSDLSVSTTKMERRWLIRRATDAAGMTVGSLAVVWTVVGDRALATWLDVPPPHGVAPVVALLMTLSVLSVVAVRYLVRAGLESRLGPMAAGELMLTTVLSLGLIGPWGMRGVLLAIVLAHTCTLGWRAPWLVCRDLRIKPLLFARARILRLGIGMGPPILAGLALSSLRAVRTGRDLALVAMICLILHAVAAWTSWHLLAQRLGVEND